MRVLRTMTWCLAIALGALAPIGTQPVAAQATAAMGCANDCECFGEVCCPVQNCTTCHATYLDNYCPAASDCLDCHPDLQSVDAPVAALFVGGRLERTSAKEAAGLVAEFPGRILLVPERGMAIVLGGCSGASLAATAFIDSDVVEALSRAGASLLDDYLVTTRVAQGTE